MSRNPYHAEGQEPTLRQSVFAMLDILGYSEIVKTADRSGTSQERLRSLHRALIRGRDWLEDKDASSSFIADLSKKDLFALKAFTDNVVVGWPVHEDAEVELGHAFFKLGAFQFQLTLDGYFIRGAISIGDAYVDEYAVFGSALMEAHDGEAKLARDPRIILSPSAVAACKKHLTYYGNARQAPQVRDVLRDSDGQWFVNYLECVLWAESEQGPFFEELEKHKQAVESKLREHQANPPIWSKYAWVASYHNYFCDLHRRHFTQEHKVHVDLFRAAPALIVD